MSEEEIADADSLTGVLESSEKKEVEEANNSHPKFKVTIVKEHLTLSMLMFIIKKENTSPYYDHMRHQHLCESLIKEINSTQSQT